MAKIDEERILIKISLLIRDTDSEATTSLLSANLITQIGDYVSELYIDSPNIIVEAYDATDYPLTIPTTTTTTTAAPTTTTTTTTTTTAGP
jgi:hypothetical protein